ncbi:MAG: thioredoxin family protein, partial [Syntrophothermus sp.]
MQNVFDTVLASSDLSLDRVLNAGLPVALVFYEQELPADLRQSLDEQARRTAGRALIVTLNRSDAAQAASRFNVRQFPSLVTVREGKPLTTLAGLKSSDLGPHLAYLLGEGPLPSSRPASQERAPKQDASAGPVAVGDMTFDREV